MGLKKGTGARHSIEQLERRRLLSAAHILTDINQTRVPVSIPTVSTDVNGTTFFAARDNFGGDVLWKSDGTSQGTAPIAQSPDPQKPWSILEMVDFDGTLYFAVQDNTNDAALWMSDGTSQGTVLVADIGGPSQGIQDFAVANSTLFFVADDGIHGGELWKSDGTPGGTMMVKDITPGVDGSWPQSLTAVDDKAYFWNWDNVHASEVWVSDGTDAGTHIVKDISSDENSGPYILTGFNRRLYFSYFTIATGDELWSTDGTLAGTVMVGDFDPGPDGSNPGITAAAGNTLYFTVWNGSAIDLWQTTGGTPQTSSLVDTLPLRVDNAVMLNGHYYFVGADNTNGTELWKTDLTGASTMRVTDLVPGNGPSDITNLTVANGALFFIGWDGSASLYKSDGSSAGTVKVNSGGLGAAGMGFNFLVPCAGSILTSWTGNAGTGIWSVDSSTGVATYLKTIGTRTNGSDPHQFLSVDGTVYFAADDGIHGTGLWKTDGTPQGTLMVKDVRSYPLFADDGLLFFEADDGLHGDELWRSDGTEAGTFMLADANPGDQPSYPDSLISFNGLIYFRANGQLWKTDGTVVGTELVLGALDPIPVGVVNGHLLLEMTTAQNGAELWTSDGSAAGTLLLKDINAGSASSYPFGLATLGNQLFFTAYDSQHGLELWSTDGTAAGTSLFYEFTPGIDGTACDDPVVIGNTLYFVAQNSTIGEQLWKTDGTAAGTVMVKQIEPTQTYDLPRLQNVGGKLMFLSNDPDSGREWWITDGTPEGTRLVVDLTPGPDSTVVAGTEVVGKRLYFSAVTNGVQLALWRTDGTGPGTSVVSGTEQAATMSLFELDAASTCGTLVFALDDQTYGLELAILDETPPAVTQANFEYQTNQQITISFSEQVGASVQAADLLIAPLAGGPSIAPASVTYDSATRRATFTFASLLPDGNYRATLSAAGITDYDGNPMPADKTFDFFVLGGDANHDRIVDIRDLRALATNWGGTGKTFSQGDFDYDGDVDRNDLSILARNWQQNLSPPPPSPTSTGSLASRRSAMRVITLIQ